MDNVCYPCRLIYASYLSRKYCDICGLPLLSVSEEKSQKLNGKWTKKGDSLWYKLADAVLKS